MQTQTKQLFKYLILPMVLLTVAVMVAVSQSRPDFLMHVHFYDDGTVNTALIRSFTGRKAIVDGGPTDAILKNIGGNLPFFDRTIDLVVLTTTDSKHMAGLVDVLKRYKVGMVVLPSEPSNLSVYQELMILIAKQKTKKITAEIGQKIWLDQGTVFEITSDLKGQLGMTLSFGKTQILFPDDKDHNVELVSDGTKVYPHTK
jgi:beta-lactamase superfamily II metal-dependent hydrolase